MINLVVLLVCSVLLANDALAAGVSNRPTNANSSEPVGKGNTEVSIGGDWEQKINNNKISSFITDITYGVSENAEFGLKFPFVFNAPKNGKHESNFGQFNVFGLWNFLQESKTPWSPAASIASQLYIKTSEFAKVKHTDKEDIDVFLILSKYFGNHHLLFNIGYIIYGDDEDATVRDVIQSQLADEWEILSWFTFVAEINIKTLKITSDTDQDILGQVGFILNLAKNLKLDMGFTFDLRKNADTTDNLYRSGITLNF